MNSRPIGQKILMRLDPPIRMVGSLHMPDEDYIRYCSRCGTMMEKLSETKCSGTEEYGWDKYRDRPVFQGVDHSHQIESVKAPAGLTATRIGTVLACGPRVTEVGEGDRVLIPFASGEGEDVRLVRQDAVLASVEEE